MRIGFVLGPSSDQAAEVVDQLAHGAPDGVESVNVLRRGRVTVAARLLTHETFDGGPDAAALHDGRLPGDAIPPAGSIPDCGVVLHADSRRITVSRDRIGIRPFHFARTDDGVLLGASQLAGLAAQPGVRTIEVVPPGYVVEFEDGQVRLTPGATAPEPTPTPAGLDDPALTALLRSALIHEVARRVPAGECFVLLSGGVDSSTVLALARRTNPRVRAVTVATADSPDLVFARRLTDDLGVPLEVIPAPGEDELLGQLDEMVTRLETWESQVITHAFPTWTALTALRGRTSVVLTGEGSDELMGGYRSGNESPAEMLGRRLRELGNLHRTSCQRLDRLGAAAGIEVRVSFLAPAVVRAGLTLPAQALVRDGLSKAALRAAMHGDLPDYILNRPKLTFARGAGYRYGSQAEGRGLLSEGFDRQVRIPQVRRAEVDRLSSGAFERYTLGLFLESRYDRAAYLMSRTL